MCRTFNGVKIFRPCILEISAPLEFQILISTMTWRMGPCRKLRKSRLHPTPGWMSIRLTMMARPATSSVARTMLPASSTSSCRANTGKIQPSFSPTTSSAAFTIMCLRSGNSTDGIAPSDLLPTDICYGTPGVGDCNFTYTGYRVPLIVISPYAKKNYVSHTVADTTAILKSSKPASLFRP